MAIDDRQSQIKEGAGLEESRLNVEFIDWLRKWSTPLLIVIAIAALGYVLYNRYQQAKITKVNEAFASLEEASASANPSPFSLIDVAEKFDGVRAVPVLARLRAADAYLAAVRRGLDPGAQLDDQGQPRSESDLMDERERAVNLDEAARLYQQVLDESRGTPGFDIHAISAAYGLAAVAESRGDMAGAKSAYERVAELANTTGFPDHARIAQERLTELDSRARVPVVYAQAQLPKIPWAPEPTPAPAPTAPDAALPGALPTPLQPESEPPVTPPVEQPAPSTSPAEQPPAEQPPAGTPPPR